MIRKTAPTATMGGHLTVRTIRKGRAYSRNTGSDKTGIWGEDLRPSDRTMFLRHSNFQTSPHSPLYKICHPMFLLQTTKEKLPLKLLVRQYWLPTTLRYS